MLAIVDYGAGNVYNVQKAFASLGIKTKLTADKKTLLNSQAIILPGVGAFKQAMENLEKKGLIAVLRQAAKMQKPILGICLGMQLLFTESEEFGLTKGLDLIPGRVIRLPEVDQLVPQVGWNQNNLQVKESIFKEVDQEYTYFVHSYYVQTDQKYIVTSVDYGVKVPGIVQKGQIYGMQFHPEKSSQVGLNLLKAFIKEVNVDDFSSN